MRRRELLGCVGSGSVAMMALGAVKAGEDQPQEPRGQRAFKDPRTTCFEQCENLAKLCLVITNQLLEDLSAGRGNAEAIVRVHRALADTREFCSLVATMVVRNSPFQAPSCLACADVCDRSAIIAKGVAIEHKNQVVEQLEECAAICREVAKLG